MVKKNNLILFCFIIFFSCSCVGGKNILLKTPDICQGSFLESEVPNHGKAFCGPTTSLNILIYLNKNGYPNIFRNEKLDKENISKLIEIISSKNYMNTSLKKGTDPFNLMYGLEKYLSESGYKSKISFKGWQYGGKYFIGTIPEKEFIENSIIKRKNIILQIGWYKKENNFYKRIGGHYINLIGINENNFIVHDPSIRSGIEEKNELVTFEKISSGKLSAWEKYKERSAKNFLKVKGLALREGADTAIIDGVIVLDSLIIRN